MNISYYIEKGWGTYNDFLNMSVRDIIEIKVGIESRRQEETLEQALKG